jgi:hypothetical protein
MTDGGRLDVSSGNFSEGKLDPQFQDPYVQKWMGEHLIELRRSVSERRFRYQILWIGLILGLIVYVAGYFLKVSVTTEPLGLMADLLYTLGFALWTGVVVVLMVEIIPLAKERQVIRALDAYEAAVRAKAAAAPPSPSPDDESPTVS